MCDICEFKVVAVLPLLLLSPPPPAFFRLNGQYPSHKLGAADDDDVTQKVKTSKYSYSTEEV